MIRLVNGSSPSSSTCPFNSGWADKFHKVPANYIVDKKNSIHKRCLLSVEQMCGITRYYNQDVLCDVMNDVINIMF